jgi:hypothetical protein
MENKLRTRALNAAPEIGANPVEGQKACATLALRAIATAAQPPAPCRPGEGRGGDRAPEMHRQAFQGISGPKVP